MHVLVKLQNLQKVIVYKSK